MANGITSKWIKVDELDVRYFTGGAGEPLVIIHGGSGGASAWLDNIRELSANYTVYIPDLPGFGQSQPLAGDYYIPELTEFLDRFSHSLGLTRFHLVGHSLGGSIALHYALRFPHRIKKLVLVSSMCLGREIALWVRFLSSRVLCRAIGKTALAILRAARWLACFFLAPAEFAEPICQASLQLGSHVTTLKEQTTILLSRLSEIAAPTLVVWGAKDPIVPARQALAAARLIPDCQVKVFADGGHSVYRQKLPEFNHLLRRFLG